MSPSDGRRAAEAYAAVDRATRPRRGEPLWLPAAWLAVVLTLTAAAPSLGAGDGWRARGSVRPAKVGAANPQARAPQAAVRQVTYQDDIAGPAIRTGGGVIYDGAVRGAQQEVIDAGDPLRDSFQRPFGVDEPSTRPSGRDADEADELFDDLPADTPPAEDQETAPIEEDSDTEARPGSVYDNGPARTPEVVAPGSLDGAVDEGDDEGGEQEDESEEAAEDRREYADKLAKERTESMESCSEGLAQLKASRLDMIDLRIAVSGSEGEDFPYNCTLDDGSLFAPRCWCEVTYMWKASGLCHKPLYFEDVHLERYGHSWGPIAQPILSGAHFFGTLPILPYKMGLQAPNECVYALGYYRPGNCAPYLLDPIPFTWRAALFQAGATVGVAAILP